MNVNPFSYLIEKLKGKVDKSGDTMSGNLTVDRRNGTTLATAWSAVVLGNNKPSGTDKNSFGVVRLYGENQAFTDIYAPDTTSQNRDITFPNKNGTVALTSDIPTQNKIASYVSLSSTSSSNKYTVPSDGYIYVDVTEGNTGYITILGSNEGNTLNVGGSKGYYATFVRSGMKAYKNGNVNSYFMPLS